MKRQLLLTSLLHTEVAAVVYKNTDIVPVLLFTIWAFLKNEYNKKIVFKISPRSICKYCKSNGKFRSDNFFSSA